MKHHWSILIALSLTACPSPTPPASSLRLEYAVGTAREGTTTRLGFFARVRKDAIVPTADVALTVGRTPGQGPTENFIYPIGTGWFRNVIFQPPQPGTFNAKAQLGLDEVAISATLSDATVALDAPNNVNVTSATPTSVVASWAAVPGAKTYLAEVIKVGLGGASSTVILASKPLSPDTSANFSLSPALDPAKSYRVRVTAFSDDPASAVFDHQINQSIAMGYITFGAGATGRSP